MHKELVYLKGLAKMGNYNNTLKAINLACKLHDGQKRKTGEDYIEHPMRVTKQLVSLKLYDDFLWSACILHDSLEDCEVSINDLNAMFNNRVVSIVKLLTKTKDIPTSVYYKEILIDPFACLIKISDRCHNVSTMVEAFTKEKIKEYIKETEDYVIPLCKLAVIEHPQYSDEIYSMRYHIESVCYALTVCIKAIEEMEVKNEL